ncbi:hypothetical protein B0H63DRAFT_523803 [Podospora didyma]|uniref:Uncharacterized protein n=1 Tax=Podospora didyma TaxID=330526 RepID=A0AAE0TVN7_9PEZI|nr:hypothetical protein B0H63DRAFT_523803 [Podospora didyma]
MCIGYLRNFWCPCPKGASHPCQRITKGEYTGAYDWCNEYFRSSFATEFFIPGPPKCPTGVEYMPEEHLYFTKTLCDICVANGCVLDEDSPFPRSLYGRRDPNVNDTAPPRKGPLRQTRRLSMSDSLSKTEYVQAAEGAKTIRRSQSEGPVAAKKTKEYHEQWLGGWKALPTEEPYEDEEEETERSYSYRRRRNPLVDEPERPRRATDDTPRRSNTPPTIVKKTPTARQADSAGQTYNSAVPPATCWGDAVPSPGKTETELEADYTGLLAKFRAAVRVNRNDNVETSEKEEKSPPREKREGGTAPWDSAQKPGRRRAFISKFASPSSSASSPRYLPASPLHSDPFSHAPTEGMSKPAGKQTRIPRKLRYRKPSVASVSSDSSAREIVPTPAVPTPAVPTHAVAEPVVSETALAGTAASPVPRPVSGLPFSFRLNVQPGQTRHLGTSLAEIGRLFSMQMPRPNTIPVPAGGLNLGPAPKPALSPSESDDSQIEDLDIGPPHCPSTPRPSPLHGARLDHPHAHLRTKPQVFATHPGGHRGSPILAQK